ncbi:MAG: DUF445 family protein [Aquamicrobium sp.]|uniref:DUF445 domain-containing protein n=1 Tax=Aquamicrobium sp. TaxID=1872579 RepID=UPI00349EEFD1|nr:DUF445 family protein [Aquamicrobium sp.]
MKAALAGGSTPDTSDDVEREKLAALRRTKAVATAALALCVAVFLTARAFEESWPALAYVAAFAEAAAIGGLADWYAVVALFRRPLGLPIPHTAIIPRNKDRIADNLGRFIEVNFLAPAPVREKLRQVDFALLVADWLADPRRAAGLARFTAKLVPQALAAAQGSGLRDFVGQRLAAQIGKVELAPLAADLLSTVTADRRHQRLFDEFMKIFGGLLRDEETLAAIRDRIRQELPSLARMFQADAYLVKRLVAAAGTLLAEAEADPDHALRREFDRFVENFVHELRESPAYAARAEKLKRDLLARPELAGLAENFWAGLRAFADQDIASDDSLIRRHLADMFAEVGRQLRDEPAIRADMNHGFVIVLSAFVENQKSGVSAFIADQVRSWDIVQLTRLIELNIGRDLQYIRFNGMLIGGLAGLALHVGQKLVFG